MARNSAEPPGGGAPPPTGATRRTTVRPLPLFLGWSAFLCLCLFGLLRLEVGENAAAMLPDQGPAARDFQFLQQAPFAQRVLVSLEDMTGLGPERLTETSLALARELNSLGEPLIANAVAGPPATTGGGLDLLQLLLHRLPRLVTEQDLALLAQRLAPKELERRLGLAREQLLGPQGLVLQEIILQDPLDLRTLGLSKLRQVNLLPGMRLHNGAFLSRDGKHALVVATTDITMTDMRGAAGLLAAVDRAIQRTTPPEIRAGVICGHRYTLANADAIKKDLGLILPLSIVGLAALFALVVRTWRILFVLLAPALAFLGGVAALSLTPFFPVVSGVTLGFGGVLMGISVDFSLHVFTALRRTPREDRSRVLAELTRPLLYSGVTTAGAFCLMLLSDLPGVRQLSVFALAGLATALATALFLLPYLPLGAERPPSTKRTIRPRGRGYSGLVLAVWLLALLVLGWFGRGLVLHGDLRQLALQPPQLLQAEEDFRQTWGDVRGQAMVFAPAPTLEQALVLNDAAYQTMDEHLPEAQRHTVLSLAPLLPSQARQDANLHAWQEFWAKRIALLRQRFQAEAKALDFAPRAFAPFFQYLERTANGGLDYMTPEDLHEVGLGPLLDILIQGADAPGQERLLLTLADDTPELRQLFGMDSGPGEPRLVSQERFREEMGQALERDFSRFMLLAGGVVLLLVLALFRSPIRSAAALAPVLTALATLGGGMALAFGGLNIYGVVAAVLSIGLAVDYGIFMAWRPLHSLDHGVERAVTLSALSTLLGFGVLALATHPALHTLGLAVLLGLAGALPAALLVTPAIQRGRN
jgi:uncharacterized protein